MALRSGKRLSAGPSLDDRRRAPAVAGKPVHVAFDGGRLTSDAGILLLAAIEQRLGIAERLADCIEDPRAPERVLHGLAEMIRYRALLIDQVRSTKKIQVHPQRAALDEGHPLPGRAPLQSSPDLFRFRRDDAGERANPVGREGPIADPQSNASMRPWI
jgi:Transposase DDE domain group 1